MAKLLLNGFFLLITVNVCSRSIESRVGESADASTVTAVHNAEDVETVLRRLSDFYRQAVTLEVETQQIIRVTTCEMEDCVSSRCAIAAARPNRLSVCSERESTTFHLVSDGERLVTWVPNLDQYSETTAPDSFEPLLQNRMAVRSAQFVLHLLADAPYEMLMEGVIEAGYVGREQIDGADVHHLHMVQKDIEWDAWVQAEGDPLLLQVCVDMSGAMQQSDGPEGGSGNMTITETFHDWRINAPLKQQSFTCVRPEWAGKTDIRDRGALIAQQSSHRLPRPEQRGSATEVQCNSY
jgi:hypothetical protein